MFSMALPNQAKFGAGTPEDQMPNSPTMNILIGSAHSSTFIVMIGFVVNVRRATIGLSPRFCTDWDLRRHGICSHKGRSHDPSFGPNQQAQIGMSRVENILCDFESKSAKYRGPPNL